MRSISQGAENKIDALKSKLSELESATFQQAYAAIQVQQNGVPKRKPLSSSPGSAYQFQQKWFREEFKSSRGETANRNNAAPENAALDNATIAPRGVSEGPKGDLDKDFWEGGPYQDTSWDRIDVPSNIRRANLRFKSRARELVTDENAMGIS